MKVVCSGCRKAYEIPEERLPRDKEVSFPCPACKTPIRIDLRKAEPVPPASPPPDERPPAEPEKNWPRGEALSGRVLGSIERLPSIPQVVLKAQQVLADPKAGNEEVARVIETDQGITATVLKVANSAFYNQSGKVSSIMQASVLLGLKTLGEAISMAGTAALLGGRLPGYNMEAGELWRHSLAVACGTRTLARMKRSVFEGEAFLAGLLHDIGKLVLNTHAEDRKELFTRFMDGTGRSFLSGEKEVFGFDHADMGYEMCAKWQFPTPLTAAIRYHHHPNRSMGHDLAYFVHVADQLSLMAGYGVGTIGPVQEVDAPSLRYLDLKQPDLDLVTEEIKKHVEEMAT